MTLLQNKKRFYNREKALGIAFELNSDEQTEDNPEVWRFLVKECEHDNLAFIEVYDHENEFVGYWDL
jgi:hypothetical protein